MPLTYDEMKFNPAKRKRFGKTIACAQCGREFYLFPSYAKEGRKYCSRECYKIATSANKITKICPQCGKPFEVNIKIADRYTVCSRACRLAETKYITCERCGKIFASSKKGITRHFCSEECRRPPIFINCATCGKTFRIIPADTNRKFCSMSCYHKSQGETSIEKFTRIALNELCIPYIQEARIGRYSIDFLLTDLRVALEIDGTYWHRDPKRDERKSRYLATYGWFVIRISDIEIKNTGNLSSLIVERINMVTNRKLSNLQPTLI